MALAALGLGACLPPRASFEAGLGTSRISGVVDVSPPEALAEPPLIVVLEFHHQFINLDDGAAVLRGGAQVLQASRRGGYVIHVPNDVVSMDVLFIAPEHLTEIFRFRRQLGVGDIQYHASLPRMNDWRSHYYTFLVPQLEYLITEPRYRLDPAGQRLLGTWLQAQNSRLAALEPTDGTRASERN